MILRIFQAISFLCSVNCLAADTDPFSAECQEKKEEAELIIDQVVNKKTYKDLTVSQKKFVDDHQIDLSRPIEKIYFANMAQNDSTGEILGRNIVQVSYFDRNDTDKESLVANRTQSSLHSINHLKCTGFIGFEYEVSTTKLISKIEHLADKMAQHASKRKKVTSGTIGFSRGPGEADINGKIVQIGAHEVLINGEIYSYEEASKKLGYEIKPISISNINITFQRTDHETQQEKLQEAINEMISATEALRSVYVESVKHTYQLDPASTNIDQVYLSASVMVDTKWPKQFEPIFKKYELEQDLRNRIIRSINQHRSALDAADTPTIDDSRKAWQKFFDQVKTMLQAIK